jgi:hypothetical protein
VTTNGNLGINIHSPTENLSIQNTNASASIIATGENQTATLLFGTPYEGRGSGLKAAIIAQGKSNWSRSRLHFCLEDAQNTSDAAISTSKMMIDSNGFVGIATTSPGYRLDLGVINFGPGDGGDSWKGRIYAPGECMLRSGGVTWLFGANSTLYGPGPYSNGSDSRIKENIVDVDDTSALAVLRQIQPKRYNYVDRQNRGDQPVWGFIAQQIAGVLDYAVDTITQFIPNVYEQAGVASDNHTITLNDKTTTDLAVGMKVQLIKSDKTSFETTITSIVDNKNFTVESDLTEDQVFVYGIQVDNFHSLKKDAIFTIAPAALQEVDRQLQAERQQVANLEQFIQSKFPGEFTP